MYQRCQNKKSKEAYSNMVVEKNVFQEKPAKALKNDSIETLIPKNKQVLSDHLK
jgi:hypothetical protein